MFLVMVIKITDVCCMVLDLRFSDQISYFVILFARCVYNFVWAVDINFPNSLPFAAILTCALTVFPARVGGLIIQCFGPRSLFLYFSFPIVGLALSIFVFPTSTPSWV